jgi:2-polyprenyl-6-methoxyphenol hydroxylase-like FAD-dependent oxidoreductase
MSRRVLVSGASIAGPAIAWWLQQSGFEVTVVERASALRTGGYKIDVRGAALEVLDRMGLLQVVRAAEVDMQTLSFVDAKNRRLATVPASLFMARGKDDVEIMRGELSALLFEATRDRVEYIFGDSITALVQHDEGVDVRFEHGGPRSFDFVVGADGLHSRVRSLAFGEEKNFNRSLAHGVAIFSVPNHLGLDREELIYSVPGRTVNLYSTKGAPDARAMFLFREPEGGLPREREAQQQFLRDTFSGAGWETDTLLAAMPGATDFYFDPISQIQMERWSSGRVFLIGDAAYAPSLASGQGTSLALVGAFVLARELAKGDAPGAAYETAMRSFVEKNQQIGRDGIARMVSSSRLQNWFGTQFMKLLPKLPWREAMVEKIVGPIQAAAKAITLDAPAS